MKPMCRRLNLLRHALSPLMTVGLALGSQTVWAQACTTTGVAPVFGEYQASGSGSNIAGSVSVSCVVLGVLGLNVSYTIKLGLGNQAQGMQRRMKSGMAYLGYNFFCDSSHSQIWADGSGASCVATGGQAGLLGTLNTVHPLYGRIPGGQYVASGTYNDTVVIEVLY